MAREISTEQVTITKTERSWRINIETPRNEPYTLTAFRETVSTDPNGSVFAKSQDHSVFRPVASVYAEEISFDVGGQTYKLTPAVIAKGLELFIEKWRLEDITPKA